MDEMKKIEGISVSDRLDGLWNIQVKDWIYGEELVDLQDLLVRITTGRAHVIESEIQPQSVRMRTRNTKLEYLGDLLGKFSAIQSKFDPDVKDGKESFSPDLKYPANKYADRTSDQIAMTIIGKYDLSLEGETKNDNKTSFTRSQTEEIIQLIKTKMDKYNNESQSDMTRLQGLVDRRDTAFTTASQLLSGVSDTRTNLIKAL